jgi:hypothetical protein
MGVLGPEDIRIQAKVERVMRSGVEPFVTMDPHQHLTFPLEVLEHCGVEPGQPITLAILTGLRAAFVRHVEAAAHVENFEGQG